MSNMTLALPDNISKNMKNFPEVRWSQVARKAIIEKLETLKLAEEIAQKSQLTKKDLDFFNKKIKSQAAKRFD